MTMAGEYLVCRASWRLDQLEGPDCDGMQDQDEATWHIRPGMLQHGGKGTARMHGSGSIGPTHGRSA